MKTSSAFNLSLTTATDKTSLKSYNISSTSSGADNIQLTDIASGSTVTVSDDVSWDGASTADTDDTGDIGTIGIDTTAGGSVTLLRYHKQRNLECVRGTHSSITLNVAFLCGVAQAVFANA